MKQETPPPDNKLQYICIQKLSGIIPTMKMKGLLSIFGFLCVLATELALTPWVLAVPVTPAQAKTVESTGPSATKSAIQNPASPSGQILLYTEKNTDITQPSTSDKGRLEKVVENQILGDLSPFNAFRYAIKHAVAQGVPANTLVLLLLFPLVTTVVIAARHIIGLKSFGIFTPTLLSVALLALGLWVGVSLFLIILAAATGLRVGLRRIRIQYLPRMALFMWGIAMVIFAATVVFPLVNKSGLVNLGIFPILILILLAEDFLDVQITRSFSQALILTLQTLIVAIVCFFLMSWESLQTFSLVHPELLILGILAFIAIIERYAGLRLLEIWRFRKIISW